MYRLSYCVAAPVSGFASQRLGDLRGMMNRTNGEIVRIDGV